jgi:hypothetical protein
MPVSLARATTIIASLTLMVVLAAPAAAISPSFDPPTALDIAGSAQTVAVGDFNGDGAEDLAAAYNRGPGAVSLWSGTGDPAAAFEHRSPDVAVGVSPNAIAVDDFNGDGRDDLAVANTGPAGDDGDDDVSILLGGPSGLVDGGTLTVGDVPNTIDSGDLDGDGDADLVVANLGLGSPSEPSAHVSVLSGNGAGHFEVAHHAVGCRPTAAVIADLVGGGGREVAAACAAGPAAVRIFAPDASGDLHQVGTDHPVCSSPVDLDAGDFDGLGTADLAVACLEPRFAVLGSDIGFAPLPGPNHTASNPEPSFIAAAPMGIIRSLARLEVVDVNSDGFDDVLATDVEHGHAVVADGRANSRFLPETLVGLHRRVGTAFPIDPALADVTAADINEDGKRDLVAAADDQIVIRYATTPVPGVRTGSASGVGHNAATVGAVVNPSGTGSANETTYRFQYGTTAAYGQTTAALPQGRSLGGDSSVPVSAVLGGLTPETEYHYRVVASNGHGTTYGRDRVFRTGATTPPSEDGGGGGAQALDTTRPRLSLSVSRTIKRAKLLRRGVRLTVVPNEPSTLAFELVGSTRTVRLARVGDVVLAERRLPLTAVRRSVTLKLPRRFHRRSSRRFRLTVRVAATDSAGNRAVTTRRLRVR